MMKILADASLPYVFELFSQHFELDMYQHVDEVYDKIKHQDILLCRTTLSVNKTLLEHSKVRYVLTASSGIDHIDLSYLSQEEITLIDAKGCNSEAVSNYVQSCIAYLSQGQYITGLKAGIIGLGEVGNRVAECLHTLGFQLYFYDPPKALRNAQFHSCSLNDLLACNVLCIHANLHECPPFPSKNLLHKEFLCQLPPKTCIINAARGDIIHETDLLECHNNAIYYCTDVYSNEPNIRRDILQMATLCTPHIAGHSIEAKNKAMILLCQKLHQHLGIPVPDIALLAPKPQDAPNIVWESWEDYVLSLYHPISETMALKNSKNISTTFQSLRRAHQLRHDFCCYKHPKIHNIVKKDKIW